MADPGFPRLVSLACHDLRTPLATIGGFAKTLNRAGELDERSGHFVELIDAAAEQMTELLELLGLAARIEAGHYEPALTSADTLELASRGGPRVHAIGTGAEVETDVAAVGAALAAFAVAASRHGGVDEVTWTVDGRALGLAPVNEAAATVLSGEQPKDLGSLVANRALGALDVAVQLDGDTLHVTF
jgi:light-regulated signal transduction histidine kinase (bacteriophytochrome)